MRGYAAQFPDLPNVSITRVANINDADTLRVLEDARPDLVVVSGTNLVGGRIIALAGRGQGIVNMHTGISPYVKGGPNCTNWCLAKRTFHLIGNTVMWLDPGVDSGPLIATEQTRLTGEESLTGLHLKVMEHAHDLYSRVLSALEAGREVPSVPQKVLGEGQTFYTREWNARMLLLGLYNFRRWYRPDTFRSEEFRALSSRLVLLPCDQNSV